MDREAEQKQPKCVSKVVFIFAKFCLLSLNEKEENLSTKTLNWFTSVTFCKTVVTFLLHWITGTFTVITITL